MLTAPRILRAEVEASEPPPPFTPRQQARHDRILRAAELLLSRHGREGLNFATLAMALRIGTAALRFHFVDMEALIGCILRSHLAHIVETLEAVPREGPDWPARMRAAYFAATRTSAGAFLQPHQILLRDAWKLPPDERDPIDETRAAIAALMLPALGHTPLSVLDLPLAPAALERQAVAISTIPPGPPPSQADSPPEPPPDPPRRPNYFMARDANGQPCLREVIGNPLTNPLVEAQPP